MVRLQCARGREGCQHFPTNGRGKCSLTFQEVIIAHSQQSKLFLFILVSALVLLALLQVTAPHPDVVIPDPAAVAPLQELHEQTTQGYFGGVKVPEAAPQAVEPAKPAAPAKVTVTAKRPAKNVLSEAERNAWMRGWLSAARAKCLRHIVDYKIAGDIEIGRIRDFSTTALEAPICRDEGLLATLAFEMVANGELASPK